MFQPVTSLYGLLQRVLGFHYQIVHREDGKIFCGVLYPISDFRTLEIFHFSQVKFEEGTG